MPTKWVLNSLLLLKWVFVSRNTLFARFYLTKNNILVSGFSKNSL